MEQIKMFNDSEMFQKQRPTGLTDSQNLTFFTDMAKEVRKNNWSSNEVQDIAKDLSELNLNQNGFELGKDLDEGFNYKASYNIDVLFLEFLENIQLERMMIVNDNVKNWVKAHDIKPKLEKGFDFNANEKIGRFKDSRLYISDIYPDTAQYVVKIKDGDKKRGFLFDYEKIEENI
jgi:uncharacterized protein YfkK (UPF0435 family)